MTMILSLTACQKTTPFVYDSEADLLTEAEKIISGPGLVFDPTTEKIVVITAAFNGGGEGVLQEYQMGKFGAANVNTLPGGKVVVSVPHDPRDGTYWQLTLNEHKATSRAYLPEVYEPLEGVEYDRLNFLLEPQFDSEVFFTRLTSDGDELWTFKVAIHGTTAVNTN